MSFCQPVLIIMKDGIQVNKVTVVLNKVNLNIDFPPSSFKMVRFEQFNAYKQIKFLLIILLALCFLDVKSQEWKSKATNNTAARAGALSFSMNGKGYVGCGTNGTILKDMWEYNSTTNSWSQVANFMGSPRTGVNGFVIGNFFYGGLGWDLNINNSLYDMYRYNPATNSWTSIANYPGYGARVSFATSTPTRGYVGGGIKGTTTPYANDFWEYNPTTNSWSSLGFIPLGPRASGIAFSYNGYVYFGLGHNNSVDFNDLWRYNPANNSWLQMASFPGTGRLGSLVFELNGKVIVGGGHRLGVGVPLSDYYEYDIVSNTWKPICGFQVGNRTGSSSFVIGNKGYVTTGRMGSGSSQSFLFDLWEFNPNPYYVNDTLLCSGDSITFNVASAGATYLWHDGSSLPTYKTKNAGIFWVNVTQNNCTVTDTFKVRTNSSFNLDLGPDSTLCFSDTISFDITNIGASYLWEDNSTNPKRKVFQTGLYWAEVTIGNCTIRDSIFVTVLPDITLDLGPDSTLCFSDTISFDITNIGASYIWEDNSTNPKRKVFQTGLYWAEVTIGNCTKRDSIFVTVLPDITLDLGPDSTLCFSDTISFDITNTGASYLWEDNSTNPKRKVFQTGLYWAEITNGYCKRRDSLIVTVLPELTFSLGKDTVFCGTVNLTIDITTPGASYLWEDNSISPLRTITQPGLYWVELSKDGCKKRDSIRITKSNTLNLFIGNDTTICYNESILLDPKITSGSFLWQDGSVNQTYTAKFSGLYWVEVNSMGCMSRDSIQVTVNPKIDLELGNDTGLCVGDNILLSNQLASTGTFLWNDGSNGISLLASNPGLYYVQLNQGDCYERDSINIIEYQSPQINLPIDTFICLDESFVLDAFFEGASYLWNTGSISSKLVVLDSGLYSVSVTNACGTIKDSIYIDGKDCNCRIYLPNVITPNNDGLNDEFIPVYQCEIAEYELLIFNRWGNLLFTSTNVDLGWDGRFQGENASLGSYVYTIKFKVESENKYRRYLGSFTILK